MISKTSPSLSILLILAMLFSFITVTAPAAPAQAAVLSCNVTGATPAIAAAGATISVTFTAVVDNETDTFIVKAFMDLGSTSYSSIEDTRTGSGPHTLQIVLPDNAGAGNYTVYVKVGATGIRSGNSLYVRIDATKPNANVSVAETCWSTAATASYNVTYTGSKSGATSLTYLIELSNDNGANYNYTVYSGSKAPGTYTVATSPNTLGITNFSYAKVRIKVTDTLGLVSDYIYSALFYILPYNQISPAFTYPTASGLSFNGGDNITIRGTISTSGPTASYMLTLFPNGDPTDASAVYENITAGWKPVTVSGSYTIAELWKISTSVSSSSCVIALYAKDCAGNVVMVPSITFTIVPTTGARVTVNYPTSKAVLYSCATTDNITFTLFGGTETLSTCNFYASTDNKTWGSSFAYGSFPGGLNSITFPHSTWTAGTYCIKIESVNNGITSTGYGPYFTLKALTAVPSLKMTYPNGGEPLTGGQVVNIVYLYTDSSADTNMPVAYTFFLVNNGATTQIAQFTTKYTGSTSTYAWTVDDVTSANCKIKIVATNTCQVASSTESASAFAITRTGCATSTTTIDLYPGWNLISLPLLPVSTDITNVLSGVIDRVNYVYYYNSGAWKAYVPGVSTALSTMEAGKSYWVHIKGTPGSEGAGVAKDCTLTVTGRKCACGGTTPTTLFSYSYLGWNMVGFKSMSTSRTLQQYMQQSCGTIYAMPIYFYDGATQTMGSDYSCNRVLTPGQGYWLILNKAIAILAPCE